MSITGAESVNLRLPAAAPSAAVVRYCLRRFAQEQALSQQRAFDLLVVVGEAVANAIEHAYRPITGEACFEVRVWRAGDAITARVRDYGRWRGPSTAIDRGRGLMIIGSVARTYSISALRDGTAVEMTL
ncbi:MAG: ATP-binding protein [bacterium]|nr:ATP-binding protein [bacterium]